MKPSGKPSVALTKVCKVCEVEKELSAFHPNKQCKLGVVGTCRDCTRERISKWYKDNRRRLQEVANESNRQKKLRAIEYMGGVCSRCKGSFPPCVMQFHHIDGSTKDLNPSKALNGSWERAVKELNKCVMLCANCHLIEHFAEYDSTGRDKENATDEASV